MSKHSLIHLKDIMPAAFDDFFLPWNEWPQQKKKFFNRSHIPAMNISDEKDHYLISVAAPGLKKEDFSISLDGSILTIGAFSENKSEEDKKKYNRREYSYTSFSRSFTIPKQVKTDHIQAHYRDGILSLEIPKDGMPEISSAKKIEIK